MPVYRIDAKTEGIEVYYVEAASEQEAEEKFTNGDNLGEPALSEVHSASIVEITDTTED
jgi:hypothetical protein